MPHLAFCYIKGSQNALQRLGFTKLAISRLDKELRAGTILPADVVPGASPAAALYGTGGADDPRHPGARERRSMRKQLSEGSSRSGEDLRRLREMRARLTEAQIKRPDVALGLRPTKQLRVVTDPTKLRGHYGELDGPSMLMRNTRQRGELYMPEPNADLFESTPAKRSERLQRATRLADLQHEFGEFEQMLGKELTPYATHLGTRPMVREKLVATGDRGVQQEYKQVRSIDPEDAFVEKLYRQVGGTPDSPIPLEGKQHRALNKALVRHVNAGNLGNDIRYKGLVEGAGLFNPDKGRYAVPYGNKRIQDAFDKMLPELRDLSLRAHDAKSKAKSATGRARAISPAADKARLTKLKALAPKDILQYLGVNRAQFAKLFGHI